jgi:hypothetical protein
VASPRQRLLRQRAHAPAAVRPCLLPPRQGSAVHNHRPFPVGRRWSLPPAVWLPVVSRRDDRRAYQAFRACQAFRVHRRLATRHRYRRHHLRAWRRASPRLERQAAPRPERPASRRHPRPARLPAPSLPCRPLHQCRPLHLCPPLHRGSPARDRPTRRVFHRRSAREKKAHKISEFIYLSQSF